MRPAVVDVTTAAGVSGVPVVSAYAVDPAVADVPAAAVVPDTLLVSADVVGPLLPTLLLLLSNLLLPI
jgi:hypothetical protein